MDQTGYMDGAEMATTFNMLRANDLIWSFVVNNYLLGKEPFPFDLLYWNSDSTRMPRAMHSFYLRKCTKRICCENLAELPLPESRLTLLPCRRRSTWSGPGRPYRAMAFHLCRDANV